MTRWTCLETAGWVKNSVDPEQMPRPAASDLGYSVYLGLALQILRVLTL